MEGVFMSAPEKLPWSRVLREGKWIDEKLVDIALRDQGARAEIEPKTVFFLDIKPPLQGAALKMAQDLNKSVKDWLWWASTAVETKIQQFIRAGELSTKSDKAAVAKVVSFRAQLWEHIIRDKSTWLIVTEPELHSKNISCTMGEFHSELIKAVVQGSTVPPSILPKLEVIVNELKESVLKLSLENIPQPAQFCLMMTTYRYYPEVKSVFTKTRLISFRSTNTMTDLAVGKSKIEKVNFELSFTSSTVYFNGDIYSSIFEEMRGELIAKGRKLNKNSFFDFEPTD